MNIYDQLHEINEQLSEDAAWAALLEIAYDELNASDMEELIDKVSEGEDEGVITNLISEGESIISLKNAMLDEWYDEYDESEY